MKLRQKIVLGFLAVWGLYGFLTSGHYPANEITHNSSGYHLWDVYDAPEGGTDGDYIAGPFRTEDEAWAWADKQYEESVEHGNSLDVIGLNKLGTLGAVIYWTPWIVFGIIVYRDRKKLGLI